MPAALKDNFAITYCHTPETVKCNNVKHVM